MKNIGLWLLALLAFSFAAETATLDYDDPLYRIYTPGFQRELNVHPYLRFTGELMLSTSARVISGGPASNLQEGAIVCEGPITAQLNPRGIWARAGNLDQSLNYYQCDPPAHSGGVRSNQPVEWSGGIYDDFVDMETCTDGSSCWGRFSDLVSQPADYVRTGEWFRDRESRTGVVCKGTSTLRDNIRLLSTRVLDEGSSTSTNTYARGTYTFSGQMDVTGCMAIVRHPDCPSDPTYVGREEIFSRTSASGGASDPEYSGVVGPVTTAIRVVTNADLRCSAEFVSITPSPLIVAPGNSTSATVTIRNNCPASDRLCQPITVTGVSVSDGFRFTHSTSGMVPITYFTVNPGSVRSFPGTLTAPNEEGICTELTRGITFNVTYTCPGCGPAGDSISRSASYTVRFECPPGETTNLVPRFEPEMSRYDVVTGDDLNLTIITWNNGGHPSNPGETCIQIGHLEGGTTGPFVDDFPPTSYSYPVLNAGGQYGEPLDFRCTEDTENQTYMVVVNVDCPFLGTTNETDETDNDDFKYIWCRAPDTPPPGDEERYRCNIPEGTRTGIPGETYDFGLECTMLGSPVDCPNADWSYHLAGNATVAEEGPDSNTAGYWLVLGTDARGEGSVGIEAKITFPDGNATCNSLINIPLIPCEEFV